MEARRRRAVSASIYKEELKTVVRELLVCTQPNRHETSTALWNPYRRVSLRGRRAQIRFSRGERAAKNQKTTVRHFGFTEKVYGLPCTIRSMLLLVSYPTLSAGRHFIRRLPGSGKDGCGHMYGSARGRQILQYKINPNPNPNPNTNPSSPYCIMRLIIGSRVHVPLCGHDCTQNRCTVQLGPL